MEDHWILERFRAVDRKDIDAFIDLLTDDHRFLFGARPPVIGKAQAREQVLQFWSMIGRLRHNVRRLSVAGDLIFVEAEIDYERLDGRCVTIPCCDVLRTRGRKLCEQRAYLDQSALWAESAESEVRFENLIPEVPGFG